MKSLVKITKLFLGVVVALLVVGMTTTSFASSHYKYRVTRTAFDKISVGSNNGNGGTSLKQLEKDFGSPKLKSSRTVDNVRATMLVYSGVDNDKNAAAIVELINNKVIYKELTGYQYTRKAVASLNDFNNKLTVNKTTYQEALKEFGKPDEYSVSTQNGTKVISAVWSSNLKHSAKAKATMTLQFDNDVLVNKSQVSME